MKITGVWKTAGLGRWRRGERGEERGRGGEGRGGEGRGGEGRGGEGEMVVCLLQTSCVGTHTVPNLSITPSLGTSFHPNSAHPHTLTQHTLTP